MKTVIKIVGATIVCQIVLLAVTIFPALIQDSE
jgi:hypothetical protein